MKEKKILLKAKSIKSISLSLIIGLILAAGLTFAWNAVWHGTNWIQAGNVIESEKIAENFEYLYNRTTKIPEVPSCNDGDIITWKEGKMVCTNPQSIELHNKIVAGCGNISCDGGGGLYCTGNCWGGAQVGMYLGYPYCPEGTTLYSMGTGIKNSEAGSYAEGFVCVKN